MGNRRLLSLLAALAVNFLLFQSILVPYGNGNAPWSSGPENYAPLHDKVSFPSLHSTTKYSTIWNPPTVNGSEFSNSSALIPEKKYVGKNDSMELVSAGSSKNSIAVLAKDSKIDFSVKQILETKRGISTISQLVNNEKVDSRKLEGVGVRNSHSTTSSTNLTLRENSPPRNDLFASDNSTAASIPGRKKMRCNMPPKSRTLIQEMNRILIRRRASSRAMVLTSLSISSLIYELATWTSYCCGYFNLKFYF